MPFVVPFECIVACRRLKEASGSGRGLNFNFLASAKLTLTSAANFEETSECPYSVSHS